MKKLALALSMIILCLGLSGNRVNGQEGDEPSVTVTTTSELKEALRQATSDTGVKTIMIDKGTYTLESLLHIIGDGITIKGVTGNPQDVVLKGKGMYGNVSHIFLVSASGFSLEHITMEGVANHLIQVQGEKGIDGFTVRNCHFYDAFEQLLKVSKGGSNRAVDGLVEGCVFEYREGIGPQYYIGGIDVHNGLDWVVRGCTFKGIRSPESRLAEHAIHFWSASEGTLVEDNIIIDCDRGIGFGLGSSTHIGGMIRNNLVYTSRDVGIGLENAGGKVEVYNNQVYTPDYMNSIEYRFSGTDAVIYDNITSKKIAQRNDGRADLRDNVVLAESSWSKGINGSFKPMINEDQPSSWARTGIDWLKNRMTLASSYYQGYQTRETRKAFAYLSVMLYEELTNTVLEEAKNKDIFEDTRDPYVLKANSLGIINGYGDGYFRPDNPVSREQMAAMLIRTLEAAGISPNPLGISKITFADQDDISSWAMRDLRLANKYGIMNGIGDNRIDPSGYTSREQSLLLIYNILKDTDRFEPVEVEASTDSQGSVVGLMPRWTGGGAFNSWAETGWYSMPAATDLDGNGTMEIIASGYAINVLDAVTGEKLWRAPSGHDRSEPDGNNVGRTWSDIIVSDVDGDGDKEFITVHSGGTVSVYERDGYFAAGWPQKPIDRELRGLQVADLDKDGTAEIVVTGAVSSKENIWVYEHDGTLRKGWPQLSNESGYAYGVFNNNASVGDMDGDGFPEIVLPSDVHYICAYESDGVQLGTHSIYGDKKWGKVGVWESLNTELRGWGEKDRTREEQNRPNFAHGASIITDVNGDGTNEVVVTGNMYVASDGHPPGLYNALYIFNGDRSRFNDGTYDWTTIPLDTGAPLSEDYNEIENCQPDPVAADLDGDGLQEILFASYDGKVHCFSLDKTEHHQWPYDLMDGKGIITYASVPQPIDLNGDGLMEVVFTSWTEKSSSQVGSLTVLNHQGDLLVTEALPNLFDREDGDGALASPLVVDVDGDGDLEIIVNSIHSGVHLYDVLLSKE